MTGKDALNGEKSGFDPQKEAEEEWEAIVSQSAGIERSQMRLAFKELAEMRERERDGCWVCKNS